jgi:hypothetical protein
MNRLYRALLLFVAFSQIAMPLAEANLLRRAGIGRTRSTSWIRENPRLIGQKIRLRSENGELTVEHGNAFTVARSSRQGLQGAFELQLKVQNAPFPTSVAFAGENGANRWFSVIIPPRQSATVTLPKEGMAVLDLIEGSTRQRAEDLPLDTAKQLIAQLGSPFMATTQLEFESLRHGRVLFELDGERVDLVSDRPFLLPAELASVVRAQLKTAVSLLRMYQYASSAQQLPADARKVLGDIDPSVARDHAQRCEQCIDAWGLSAGP